jgi:hypothetical protein
MSDPPPSTLSWNLALIDAKPLSLGSGVFVILNDFSLALDGCTQIEALDKARKDALTKIQVEMSIKASQFIRSKFSNLSPMTRKGQMDANNNLELWKERYQRRLDANLKLIQHSRLLLIPENLAQKIIQTALKNIHIIMLDATLDLAHAQLRICRNPDSWSVDPTVKVKRWNSKS